MTRLNTIGEVASRLVVPLHRVAYIVRTRKIPSERLGLYRVFDEAAVARIREELSQPRKNKLQQVG